MGKSASRLGDVIDAVVVSTGQGKTFHGWRIVAAWAEIVGPQLAQNCRAVRFADGVLTVAVTKDAWRQELEMQREQILKKIHTLSGGTAVERIVLRAGAYTEFDDEQNHG